MTDTLIERNPDILGGTPVFARTQVPVRILMEHLEAGDRLDDFLRDHPTVSRTQAVALLERATTMLISGTLGATSRVRRQQRNRHIASRENLRE